jgi:hypothetical protein
MRPLSRTPHRATWAALLVALVVPSMLRAQAAAPAPDTHTVRKGDTLWDLAKQYKGDPFLWPDIYRLNTALVEDPHWIYPGEVLRLSGGDNVAAVPATDTPGPDAVDADTTDTAAVASVDESAPPAGLPTTTADVDEQAPLFPTANRMTIQETVLRVYGIESYRPLRRSEFYSSGFLTERDKLPFGTVLGPVMPSQIKVMSNSDVATLYTNVGIEPSNGATYQVGDSLLVVALANEIEGYGRVVVPTGLARVTEAGDRRYIATIVAVYGPIRKNQLVLPAEKFTPSPTGVRAKPVTDGVRSRLLGGKGRQELKEPQMVVFIDKGRQDGVAAGDLFEARRRATRLPDGTLRDDDVMAELQIVHVREHSATARVLNVLSPDLPPGTEVRQIAKLP